jgi:Tfp pilus assembly protein PilF
MNGIICIALVAALALGGFSGCSRWDWQSRDARPDLDSRIKDFFAGVKSTKGNPDSHFLLACYYQDRGKHGEAIDEFNKVIAIDPQNVKAYNRLGVSYDSLGDFRKASVCYQKALQLDPSLFYVHNNIGYSQILQGDFEAAAASLVKALSLNDRNKITRNNLGLAYARMGKNDLAISEFEKAGGMPAREAGHSNTAWGNVPILKISELDNVLEKQQAIATAPDCPDAAARSGGIEIANGNGARFMARDVGRYLKEKGFHVVRLTNANRFNYKRADIPYLEGYGDEARRLARELPCRCDLKETQKFSRGNVKIRVLIGKDMATYKKMFKGGASWS